MPLLGAIAWGGRVTTNFGGVDVVPLPRGAIAGCQSLFHMFLLFSGPPFHPDTQENGNEFCLELLADGTMFPTLITQKLFFASWGLCWYNLFFLQIGLVPTSSK